ncbi:serine/threonine-protein kinase [Streptomyces agglomeratus]|uniref:serine/threonine-protein kinase n=1 Tax=Streptomyces agglomeratus TaxID=285458 RepID=UPI0008540739|nr:serine/threonine-protein kinase [Streptomyces agglomeratus]OEJ51788.1 serine/threonine protein kinase [Streptomyces agglomeratus]
MLPLSTGDPLRLGPYRLLGVLGEGGMGKVYFGRDGAGGTAAVKVLRPELAHDQHLAGRFVREAQTAQAVTSDGVARVLGARTEGGRPWIAAEFLAGPTLDDAVTSYGPLDDVALRALAADLARTLQDIHAAGLVHRDLKPANIVLTSGGPRVIDFGIARPEHGLTLTTTGQIPVTPGYGAPEQVLGQRVGPPADVFSLGAVLAYAASGHRAYDGPHVAGVQYQVVHGEPEVSLVPEHVRTLVLPCLAKDPARRPVPAQIAQAFAPPRGAGKVWRQGPLADDIGRREAAAGRLAATHPAEPGDGSASPSRRRLLTTLATAGAVLAAGGGTAWWLKEGRSAAPKPITVPLAAKTPTAALLAPTAPIAPLWGPETLAGPRTPAPLPVRDVLIFEAADGGLAAHRVTDGRQKWRAPDVTASAGFVTLSDRLVVTADAEGALHAFVASTGDRAWTAADIDAERLLAADARTLYVMTRERQLRAVSTVTRKVLWSRATPVRTTGAEPPAAATGRGRLVLFPSDGHVVVVDTDTGGDVWDIRGQGTAALAPAIRGDTVFLGGRTLTALSLDDGKKIWSVPADSRVDQETGGWGPPAVRGDEVYAVDYLDLHRRRASDGRGRWSCLLRSYEGTRTLPVVQGGTVWVAESKSYGLTAVSAHTGDELAAYEHGDTASHTTAGDGNRFFAVYDGSVIAMPVRS